MPSTLAALVVGWFQLLITWFILGSDDVLLRHLPVTVAAIGTAEALVLVRNALREEIGAGPVQTLMIVALLSLSTFCFIAAIATNRGREPIGNPPELMEWWLTIAVLVVVTFAGAYVSWRES